MNRRNISWNRRFTGGSGQVRHTVYVRGEAVCHVRSPVKGEAPGWYAKFLRRPDDTVVFAGGTLKEVKAAIETMILLGG